MTRLNHLVRGLLAAAALAVLASLTAAPAKAQYPCNNGRCSRAYNNTDYTQNLFRQYYVDQGRCGAYSAPLYPAPNTRIPPHVGYTYITHPKLYPHLWTKHRVGPVRRTRLR